ncbi:hypothetical protein Pcinc_043838 [Petrolisthes cinctipes]|uniref:Uncharacterized protein n=1 Tax=Petrolisthes cinctipes TaxID=88211 RepID=A0AAE1BI10_PETCI|nr:hypothetical protein Pcinc_043838 [Petrolisthes cinctipes]
MCSLECLPSSRLSPCLPPYALYPLCLPPSPLILLPNLLTLSATKSFNSLCLPPNPFIHSATKPFYSLCLPPSPLILPPNSLSPSVCHQTLLLTLSATTSPLSLCLPPNPFTPSVCHQTFSLTLSATKFFSTTSSSYSVLCSTLRLLSCISSLSSITGHPPLWSRLRALLEGRVYFMRLISHAGDADDTAPGPLGKNSRGHKFRLLLLPFSDTNLLYFYFL